jgi:FixJ family two-component response regulator
MTLAAPLVAIVENDGPMLKALERLLRASGYAAEMFASAELYLARPSTPRVSCLILDIDLGGLNGIELQQNLVDTGRAPPIIFVTSQADGHFRERAFALGCLAYLRKPFASQELLDVLRRIPSLFSQPISP